MKAGLTPKVMRNKDSHLDLLEGQRREREGDCISASSGPLERWPTGRLEVVFPTGTTADPWKRKPEEVYRAMELLPELSTP